MFPVQPAERISMLTSLQMSQIAICSLVSSLPWSLCRANEKLGSIGVGPSVGHRQYVSSSVLQNEIFICKLLPIDGFSASSISFGKISTLTENKWATAVNCIVTGGNCCHFGRQQMPLLYLAHEARDDSVKFAALIAKALLSSAQGTEVFCRIQAAILWNTQATIYWFLDDSLIEAGQQSTPRW